MFLEIKYSFGYFLQDSWLYHLTIVSGKGPSAGTQFEQLIFNLMSVDGDPSKREIIEFKTQRI
jgi:hypothetical protein